MLINRNLIVEGKCSYSKQCKEHWNRSSTFKKFMCELRAKEEKCLWNHPFPRKESIKNGGISNKKFTKLMFCSISAKLCQFDEARKINKCKKWQKKCIAIIKNGTWTFVDWLSSAIWSKWIFFYSNAQYCWYHKYKVRLVAKGCI